MAATTRSRSNQQLRYDVLPHCLLLVAALVIGDVVVGAAGSSSPPRTLVQAEQHIQVMATAPLTTDPAAGVRRLLIGSRVPTCTYNECRGCRHSCSVQQVPVDASDPINSAYHYKCVCHM